MKKAFVGPAVVTIALVATAAAQTARPDFSGTWKMDAERSESLVNDYEPAPVTIVARQTPLDLIVETTRSSGTETLLFKLDGSTTYLPGDVVTTSRWQENSFVLNTVRKISGWTVTLNETWTLESGGRQLKTEKRLNVQHGYEGPSRDSNQYTSVRDVFVNVAGR